MVERLEQPKESEKVLAKVPDAVHPRRGYRGLWEDYTGRTVIYDHGIADPPYTGPPAVLDGMFESNREKGNPRRHL
jgi:hypothetical protein